MTVGTDLNGRVLRRHVLTAVFHFRTVETHPGTDRAGVVAQFAHTLREVVHLVAPLKGGERRNGRESVELAVSLVLYGPTSVFVLLCSPTVACRAFFGGQLQTGAFRRVGHLDGGLHRFESGIGIGEVVVDVARSDDAERTREVRDGQGRRVANGVEANGGVAARKVFGRERTSLVEHEVRGPALEFGRSRGHRGVQFHRDGLIDAEIAVRAAPFFHGPKARAAEVHGRAAGNGKLARRSAHVGTAAEIDRVRAGRVAGERRLPVDVDRSRNFARAVEGEVYDVVVRIAFRRSRCVVHNVDVAVDHRILGDLDVHDGVPREFRIFGALRSDVHVARHVELVRFDGEFEGVPGVPGRSVRSADVAVDRDRVGIDEDAAEASRTDYAALRMMGTVEHDVFGKEADAASFVRLQNRNAVILIAPRGVTFKPSDPVLRRSDGDDVGGLANLALSVDETVALIRNDFIGADRKAVAAVLHLKGTVAALFRSADVQFVDLDRKRGVSVEPSGKVGVARRIARIVGRGVGTLEGQRPGPDVDVAVLNDKAAAGIEGGIVFLGG